MVYYIYDVIHGFPIPSSVTQVPSLQLEATQLSSRLERLLREPQLEEFLGLGAGGEEIEDGWRWGGYIYRGW